MSSATKLPDLVIYHGGCPDGIGGAWAFWRVLSDEPETKFHPGRHGEEPPVVKGLNVLFVDFSYPIDVMRKVVASAKSVLVLDHHKSSNPLKELHDRKFDMILDMDRSGAQIGWDFMNPGIARPWFIDHIADRDLWRWAIPHTKATTRAMFGSGYYESFEAFDKLKHASLDDIALIGNVLLQDDKRAYTSIMKHATDCFCVSLTDPNVSWKCRVVECEGSKKSEVGNRLVQDGLIDFAAMYSYVLDREEWWVSLRALPGSDVDLTEIVKHFGNGGGHPKASGFCIKEADGHTLKTLFKPVDKDARFNLAAAAETLQQPGDMPGEPSQ